MRSSSIQRFRWQAIAALLAFGACAVHARTLELTAARLVDPYATAQDLRVRVDENAAGGSLQLSAAHFEVAQLGLAGRLEWSCPLRRDVADELSCSGPVRLQSSAGEQVAELQARIVEQRIELALVRAATRIELVLPYARNASVSASAKRVPAAWIREPLAQLWHGGELRDGLVDAQADLHSDGVLTATFEADGLVFNTFDGTFSGEALALRGTLTRAPAQGGGHLVGDVHFGTGVLRAGALRVAFPDDVVDAGIDALMRDDGGWDIARFSWRDPDALEFEASGSLEPAAVAPLRELSVKVGRAEFPLATQRYAAPIFASWGFAQLALKGELKGAVDIDAQGLQRLALDTTALDVRDRASGIAVSGITGGVDWRAAGDGVPTDLAWRKVDLAGIALGAAKTRWQSSDGALRLLGPLRMRAFGGNIELRDTRVHPFATSGERATTAFTLRELGYDNADGTLAAAHIAADGTLSLSGPNTQPRMQVDARFHGGEALVGPVYAKLPDAPVVLKLDLARVGERWQIAEFDWNDPDVLEFSASGELAPLLAMPVQSLQLDVREARLKPALQRYGQSWLAAKGYADLVADGRLSGTLSLDAGKPRRFNVTAHAASVRDGAGRFAVDGFDGALDWDIDADRPASSIGWQHFELFKIPFGAMRAHLQSRAATITLTEPLAIDVLGGQLKLERLGVQPSSPRGDRYAASFALVGVEMAQLSQALGWPLFPGNLSGGVPEIEFVGDRIELHGGLDMYVFDGHLGVNSVVLERPFGIAPSLAANVHFENLELEQVTSAFSFGGMSGRLFGTIGELRLVDWTPVAFDAWLRTDGGGRMSYKAVDDLTSIGGGGGLSASLQTMALKIFDTFGYRRLGIRCVLHDEVCTMGGVDPIPAGIAAGGADSSAAGYTIVEGSGLPRIMIVGHRRMVDWPTLVRRLQEATQGQGPVIE